MNKAKHIMHFVHTIIQVPKGIWCWNLQITKYIEWKEINYVTTLADYIAFVNILIPIIKEVR